MAESFVGKWTPDHSSYNGAEEYFTAIGQADMLKDFEGASQIEVTQNGNTLTFVTQIANKGPRTDIVRIGETDDVAIPNGPTMQAKTRLEGGRLISDIYLADVLAMTFVRYVTGNDLNSELSTNGKTFNFKATRA